MTRITFYQLVFLSLYQYKFEATLNFSLFIMNNSRGKNKSFKRASKPDNSKDKEGKVIYSTPVPSKLHSAVNISKLVEHKEVPNRKRRATITEQAGVNNRSTLPSIHKSHLASNDHRPIDHKKVPSIKLRVANTEQSDGSDRSTPLAKYFNTYNVVHSPEPPTKTIMEVSAANSQSSSTVSSNYTPIQFNSQYLFTIEQSNPYENDTMANFSGELPQGVRLLTSNAPIHIPNPTYIATPVVANEVIVTTCGDIPINIPEQSDFSAKTFHHSTPKKVAGAETMVTEKPRPIDTWIGSDESELSEMEDNSLQVTECAKKSDSGRHMLVQYDNIPVSPLLNQPYAQSSYKNKVSSKHSISQSKTVTKTGRKMANEAPQNAKSFRIRISDARGTPLTDSTAQAIMSHIDNESLKPCNFKLLKYKMNSRFEDGCITYFCLDNTTVQWTNHIAQLMSTESLPLKAENLDQAGMVKVCVKIKKRRLSITFFKDCLKQIGYDLENWVYSRYNTIKRSNNAEMLIFFNVPSDEWQQLVDSKRTKFFFGTSGICEFRLADRKEEIKEIREDEVIGDID